MQTLPNMPKEFGGTNYFSSGLIFFIRVVEFLIFNYLVAVTIQKVFATLY